MADSVEKQQFSEGSRPAHGRDAPAPPSQDPRIGEHRDHLMRLGFVWWSPPWRRRDRTRGIERSGLKCSRLAAPRRTQTRPSERYGRALAQSRCSPPRSSAPPTTTPIMPSGTRRGTGPTPAGSSRWKAGDEAAGIPSCQARAACFRAGVEGIALNAAYTSMIGAVNEAQHQDTSVHKGEAKASPAEDWASPNARPCAKAASHLRLRARNRSRPVWSFWAVVQTRLGGAGSALSVGRSAGPICAPDLDNAVRVPSRSVPAQPRCANPPRYAEGILGDVPWPMD